MAKRFLIALIVVIALAMSVFAVGVHLDSEHSDFTVEILSRDFDEFTIDSIDEIQSLETEFGLVELHAVLLGREPRSHAHDMDRHERMRDHHAKYSPDSADSLV